MSLNAIARFGFADKIEAEGGDQSSRGRAAKAQEALQRIARDFLAEKEGVYADPKLTPLGRQERLKYIGKEALRKIDDARALTIDVVERRHREIEAKFQVRSGLEVTNPNEVSLIIERRRLLADLPAEQRLAAIRQALQDGDRLTLLAVIHAPKFMRLALPEVLGDVKTKFIESQNPEQARELKQSEYVYLVCRDSFEQVYAGVAAEAGLGGELRDRLLNLPAEVSAHN